MSRHDASKLLKNEMLAKFDEETSEAQKSIDKSRKVVDKLELMANKYDEKLTDFKPAWGLGWRSTYESSKQLHDDEQQYVDSIHDYIKQLKEVLNYSEAINKLNVQSESAGADIATALTADSKTESISHLNSAIEKLQSATDKYQQLSPPPSVKELQKYSVAESRQYIRYLVELKEGVETDDGNKIMAAYNSINDLTAKGSKEQQELLDVYNTSSPLIKSAQKLDALQRKIKVDITKL